MTLYQKILNIYPELADFDFASGVITLQNDSNGLGDYIKAWNHPSFPEPTQAQLDGVK